MLFILHLIYIIMAVFLFLHIPLLIINAYIIAYILSVFAYFAVAQVIAVQYSVCAIADRDSPLLLPPSPIEELSTRISAGPRRTSRVLIGRLGVQPFDSHSLSTLMNWSIRMKAGQSGEFFTLLRELTYSTSI